MHLMVKWFVLVANRGLGWMKELNEDSTKRDLVKVRGYAGLVPIGDADGAVLIWTFDSKPGATQMLLVRLTEDEANRVHDADPYTVGLLEPVRRHLASPWTILAVKCGSSVYARPYRVPRRYSEKAFISHLDATAETCPAYMNAYRREAMANVQSVAVRVVHDVAFA